MRSALALLASLGLALPAVAEPPASLARLALVELQVEVGGDRAWQAALEGAALLPGQALRTGGDGLARVELPWMALTLTPGSRLRFPDSRVLSLALDAGRATVEAERLDSLKLVTPEAEVRGRGRAIVRREPGCTLVSCVSGRFLRRGARPGRGARRRTRSARPRRRPAVGAAAAAGPARGWFVAGARPGVRQRPGKPLELRWPRGEGSFQVELLPVGREVVLLQRDVAAPPLSSASRGPARSAGACRGATRAGSREPRRRRGADRRRPLTRVTSARRRPARPRPRAGSRAPTRSPSGSSRARRRRGPRKRPCPAG